MSYRKTVARRHRRANRRLGAHKWTAEDHACALVFSAIGLGLGLGAFIAYAILPHIIG